MKKENFIIVGITLIIVTISVSLAYFAAKIVGTPKEINLSTKNLYVQFTDNTAELNTSGISPGWVYEKTFTIENKSESDYKYNLIIKDLMNTFVTDNLQYKITCTSNNGGYSMNEFESMPKSEIVKDTILAYSVSISNGVKQVYKLELRYIDSDEQNSDMGKKFSGKLFITEGTEAPSLYDKILSDNPTRETRTDFSTTFTTTNTGTLYTSTEQIGSDTAKDVYYFAGDAKNNWVKFGIYSTEMVKGYYSSSATEDSFAIYYSMEKCTSAASYNKNCTYVYKAGDPIYWRIIRTNHDKSVKLLYSGENVETTTAYIGRSEFNSTQNDPIYVGYKYGTTGSLENNRLNTNDSTIKTYVDNWYKNNLTAYTKYLSKDAVYCNDRNLASGQSYSTKNNLEFAAYERLSRKTITPTYNCTNMSDAFSGNNTSAKLDYPVSLMTADEVVFAGGKYGGYINNSPYPWYSVNSNNVRIISYDDFWLLLTPFNRDYYHNESDPEEPGIDNSHIYAIWDDENENIGIGSLEIRETNYPELVRPVLSINSCVKWARGDGSPEKPYEILETENGC